MVTELKIIYVREDSNTQQDIHNTLGHSVFLN